jgi:hypothetical protein
MNIHSAIRLLLSCCLAVPPLLAAQSDTNTPSHDPADHPPLAKPSNLKVLPPDIPIPRLVELMIGFTQQLGVECVHCHMPKPGVDPNYDLNFASDENPHKRKARIMLQMTGEINGKYLAQLDEPHEAGPVLCGNCHQGHPVPPAFVAPPPH